MTVEKVTAEVLDLHMWVAERVGQYEADVWDLIRRQLKERRTSESVQR
ncbi:hypothetical protein [Mycolicibacterium agri]|nr:hypothetical protein [Mycolicibacterium agri]